MNPFGKQRLGVIEETYKLPVSFHFIILVYLLYSSINIGFKYFLQCPEETCEILGPMSTKASSKDETNSVQEMSIQSNVIRRVKSVDFMIQDLEILALSGHHPITNL